jgi:hypothetical protein
LVYADDVNILGGSVHPIKKNTEALVVASKETVLGVTADKTGYPVMSRDQNAGRSHNIMNDNRSLERVEQLRCFGTHLTNQNSIQEESKEIYARKCLLSFGAESFVFQFRIQKYED